MREHDYAKLGREGKGLLRSYVAKMTGQSRAQVIGVKIRNLLLPRWGVRS